MMLGRMTEAEVSGDKTVSTVLEYRDVGREDVD
jgi:hypothetical protein